MKMGKMKILILILWAGLFVFLYRSGLIPTDAGEMKATVESNPAIAVEVFVLLSVGRVLVFVPGVVLMVAGGLFFGPLTGFVLSMLSMAASQSIVFLAGRFLAGGKLEKYLDRGRQGLVEQIKEYGHEFLALGILCPVAPTDLVCLLTSVFYANYKRYIVTVIFANIPMMLLYSYLGSKGLDFSGSSAVVFAVAGIFLVYTTRIWFKIKVRDRHADTGKAF